MEGSIRSMVATLGRLELAGALALTEVARRYTEFTLGHGENFAAVLLDMARRSDWRGGRDWNQPAAEAMAEYRDYVRDLAALPGLASMTFLEQFDRLRTSRPRSRGTRGRTANRPA